MRCPDCGYFTFDYLDRCNKCRADLTGERRKLNLLDVALDPISLQKIIEELPQRINKGINREREQTGETPFPRPAAKAPLPEMSPEISLEDLGSLELGMAPKKSTPLDLNSGELELAIEGLEIEPKKGL